MPSSIKKQDDNLIAELTYRKISDPLAVLLGKTSITPNQVSFLSAVTAAVAGYYFSLGEWSFLIAGYVFMQLTFILDHLDGSLARHTKKSSDYGMWVDEIINKIHRFFFIGGLSIGIFKMTQNEFYLILGMIALFSWFFAIYISETKKRFKVRPLVDFRKNKKIVIPFSLTVQNIFGLLIVFNYPIVALWFITIISLNAYQQIFTVWKKVVK